MSAITPRILFLSLLAVIALWSPANAVALELGKDWVVRWPNPTNNDLLGLAANGNVNFVAVGNHDTIITGSSVTNLTRTSAGFSTNWSDVTWAGNKYYAVGQDGIIIASANGTTWTPVYQVANDLLEAVAWNGTTIIAAGGTLTSSGYVMLVVTSTDGINWSRISYPSAPGVVQLVWNGQVLLALMNGVTATSADGSRWSFHSLPPAASSHTSHPTSAAWAATATSPRFVVSGDTVWTSPDGVVWTESADLLSKMGTAARIAWTGQELVVCTSSYALTSPDLVTFTNQSSNMPSYEGRAIRFGSEILFSGLAGHIDTLTPGGGSASPLWTARNSTVQPTDITGIAYGVTNTGTVGAPVTSQAYVAVGSRMSWTSTNGTTWVERSLTNNTTSNYFTSVEYLPGTATAVPLFVAAGLGIFTSKDGITWDQQVAPDSTSPQVWYCVALAHGKLYASGYDSKLAKAINKVSTDGKTWTAGTLPDQARAVAANADGSVILAVGYSGLTMVSKDDGATWTSGTIKGGGVLNTFNDVVFANGMFVVCDSSGRIWNTTDGTQWTERANFSGSVNGLTRAANQFIGTSSTGLILRSFDGIDWQAADSNCGQALNQVVYGNNRLVAVGDSANITTSEGTLPVRPEIGFVTATSTMQEGGSIGITISLSQVSPIDAQVSLTYGGTAAASSYTAPAAVVIPAGATSGLIVITSKDDNTVLANKTLTVLMGTPRGDINLSPDNNRLLHTITIQDTDTLPVFDVVPTDQLAVLGTSVTFTAHANGSGTLVYQWKKNGVVIPNATSASYTIAKAAATDATSYSVSVTGNVGSANAPSAWRLGLVTPSTLSSVVKKGVVAAFSATAVGPDLRFHWRRQNGTTMANGGTISGVDTNKLGISSVVAADTNTYFCDVTLGTGVSAPVMTATTVNYTVLDTVPTVTPPMALTSRVAATVDAMPTATFLPTSWSATGLPLGTSINAATGRITGKFTKSGAYPVKIKATNLIGTSAEATWNIQVDALPTVTQGNFIALLDRNQTVNANLGGKVDITISSTGAFTGALTHPVTRQSFTGVLSGAAGSNPGATVAVPNSRFTVVFTIDKDTGVLTTSVNSNIGNVAGTGFGQVAADAHKRVGSYNFALAPDVTSPTGSPEGDGYGQFTLASTGALTVVGMLADGTSYSAATFAGTSGGIPLYAPLYASKGSTMGVITLVEDVISSYANNLITGSATWYKGPDAASRSYTGGIALMTLNADGGRYTVPALTDIVMNLHTGAGNAKLAFGGAGLVSASRSPSVNFTVVAPAKVSAPATNPASTTLVFDTGKGLFNGQFTLVDSDLTVTPHVNVTRVVPYNGIIIRPAGSATVMEGRGFFNLAQMPTSTPKTTPTTSPKLSGYVSLTK